MNKKRSVFRIAGPDEQTTLDLDRVSLIAVKGNRLTFLTYNSTFSVDFETEEEAKERYEQLLNEWMGDNAVGTE